MVESNCHQQHVTWNHTFGTVNVIGSLTNLAAISSIIFLAAATPLGSPSMRITSGGRASLAPAFASEGMMMDVQVSVLILFTRGNVRVE